MGKKKGKGKRRREEEKEVDVSTLASKLLKRSATGVDVMHSNEIGGQHGISDAALQTTVNTLQTLCGMIDPTTGKAAIKDKRYRSLRKVMYELQSSSNSTSIIATNTNNNTSLESSDKTTIQLSTSKITREISAQIDNGAYEMAIQTLQHVRKRQVEIDATNNNNNNNNNYLRPKLGAVQRWVRQLDAAGTDDPLALGVLDGILRLCAPEAILPVDTTDSEKAIWAKLGVNNESTGNNESSGNTSKCTKEKECGKVRLFPSFDRRRRREKDCDINNDILPKRCDNPIDMLVQCMKIGEDGIRRVISSPVRRCGLFRQCGFERGVDRRPPNKYDLELVTTSSATSDETKRLESGHNNNTFSGHDILDDDYNKQQNVIKSPLPYVQDSFLLENVLHPTECDRLIAAAEIAGYKPDEPIAGQPGASILAHACVWMVDNKLERTIFDRVKEFLPLHYEEHHNGQGGGVVETLQPLQPLGLNRRFRFYRYVPGRYYRPHIDGAWPPSGFDVTGSYRYDITDENNKNGLQFVQQGSSKDNTNQFESDDRTEKPSSSTVKSDIKRRQMSRLTFLIYLNDDFEGGQTTFLLPEKDNEGTLNAFPINPVKGGILVFPHGTCAAPLHEGSPVLKHCKYVVRTEVEYYV